MSERTLSAFRPLVLGTAAWLLSFIYALKVGAVSDVDMNVIVQLRLPRAILATSVGTGLAVAGAALQVLFSNPLCEPYTLGISSGAALGAVLGAGMGLSGMVAGLAGSAFVGAIFFTAIIYWIAVRRGVGNLTVLLSGVMLGLLGSSLVALWMALFDPNGLGGAVLWLLGDLSRARLQGAVFTFLSVTSLSFSIWVRRRELDALLLGEEDARAIGIDVHRIRRHLILATSLLVAICVSAGGMVGFIGLIVPHFARKAAGSLHFRLLPLCGIWGAAALTAADGFSRWIARPYELPVGVVTAIVGAPLFLWMTLQDPRGRGLVS